jgi:hypothetical protein
MIPRPDAIALFRPVPLAVPAAVLGQTPPDVVVNTPTRLHDVVVFAFNNLPLGTKLRIGSWYNQELRNATTTLCTYSQILIAPPSSLHSETATDRRMRDSVANERMPHETAINGFMRMTHTLARPDFQLSVIGKADQPPDQPGYGLTKCELKNLTELAPDVTDGSGCTGAAVVRR